MKEIKPKKNVHAGHRQRLLDTILNAGIDKVSNVVALEFILTYVIPRVDTNEIAHRLLDRFGNITEILNADWEMLAEVEGMGETSAKKLHAFVDIFDYYTDQLLAKRFSFNYRNQMTDYFDSLLRFRNVETAFIVGLDASFRVKAKMKLSMGGAISVGIAPHEVAKFVISHHPVHVCIAHNHPQGSALPSPGDEEGTKIIDDLLKSLNVGFIDHLIVGVDGIYGVKTKGYYRIYEQLVEE